MTSRPRPRRLKLVLLAAAWALLAPPLATPAATLEEQRAAFREAWPRAELGDWEPAAARAGVLRGYVLWPDLRAAWLAARLRGDDAQSVYAEARAFIEENAGSRPAADLRYRLALALAAERPREYLALYDRHYRARGIAKLDCLAVHAGIREGDDRERLAELGRALWRVAHSQADECDPVFDWLRSENLLPRDAYRERFELAIAAREFSLARYLARSLGDDALAEANRWIAARDRPREFLAGAAAMADGPGTRERLLYALERLAREDAAPAAAHWDELRAAFAFAPVEAAHIARHLALWAARQRSPRAYEMLRALPEEQRDAEVYRWLARSALARGDFAAVLASIERMPPEEREAESWQYWLAVAERATGADEAAAARLAQLAEERGYYGFLAADALGREYRWSHATLEGDDAMLDELAAHPGLVRARELYLTGLESRGRSEWDAAVAELDDRRQAQAVALAARWQWHSRAIAAAGARGLYDDLELRYPFAFRDSFLRHSAAAGIASSWAWGIARSESLFMADIRSGAGAIGIMQLMPATGRRTAAELGERYRGVATLTDPDSNIRLGTWYLGDMLRRFGGNRAVATAAYNAGPNRVEQWLPADDRLDARIWIENIPYNETRRFVRRVLVSDAIFEWRLTGRLRRLSAALDPVLPAADARYALARDAASCGAEADCGERAN